MLFCCRRWISSSTVRNAKKAKKAKRAQGGTPSDPVLLGRPSNNLKMGIVGLPNIGKSSLFNAITNSNVPAENYPFCTIDPSEAIVQVPDQRFEWLCDLYNPKKISPAILAVMDIAGLVRGASKGEGLGNAFLSNVASVDGLYHVVRCFKNEDITHVENNVDPVRDLEIIQDELQIKDEEAVERELNLLVRASKNKSTALEVKEKLKTVEQVGVFLANGKNIRNGDWSHEQVNVINGLHLLTAKPMVYVCNTSQEEYLEGTKGHHVAEVEAWVKENNTGDFVLPLSVAFELRAANGDGEVEKKTMVPELILAGYQALRLQQFFTCGPEEVRAWTIRQLSKAPQAAGVIHTDFERGFISADIMRFTDLQSLGTETMVKNAGKCIQKGKDYIMQDGDIAHFKFNVTSKKK
ncbi:GTP-binding protein YchF [Hesseltinella vesiculosa]|uniref:Obg-like ATPase 1 n=1 Tax=Hesseltinella vesiculosa TaxID=101127 RepID=A0A1X2GD94_9FUNG|nr:GTP-binding protein YchF [Hesseltinella vesiculosa]